MAFPFGILTSLSAGLKAALGRVSFQPAAPTRTSAVTTVTLVPNASTLTARTATVLPSNILSVLAPKTTVALPHTSYVIPFSPAILSKVKSFDDTLPAASKTYTPYEQLSGISTSRPDIVSVLDFQPLYQGEGYRSFSSAGSLMNAQVKLMALKQAALAALLRDLRQDQTLADQLDALDSDFAARLKQLKTDADFLLNVQSGIESASALFNLRDQSLQVNVNTLITQFFAGKFQTVSSAAARGTTAVTQRFPIALFSYVDLLAILGFTKAKAQNFTGTKIYLQILNEAKKIARAGSDELLGANTSVVAADSDPVVINRREYVDPHVNLSNSTQLQSTSDIVNANIHSSDATLKQALTQFEAGFGGLDQAFAFANSDETAYVNKLIALAREFTYSRGLGTHSVEELLSSFGFTASETLGNQAVFDAVYGQIGNSATDDRSAVNQQTLSSVASKIVGGNAVLTFDSSYVQTDNGSVYTPGAAYYVSSVTQPSDSGFSLTNATALLSQLNAVVSSYVSFLNTFSLLPLSSKNNSVSANVAELSDPSALSDELYSIFIAPSTGLTQPGLTSDPFLSLLSAARVNAALRANILMYVYCVANVANDGIPDVNAAQARVTSALANAAGLPSGGVTAIAAAEAQLAAAEAKNTKVAATVDKLVTNCVELYQEITGDVSAATVSLLASTMHNYNNGLAAKVVAFLVKVYNTYWEGGLAFTKDGFTRYSHVSDTTVLALALQLTLDTVQRYASVDYKVNSALPINFAQMSAATTIIGNGRASATRSQQVASSQQSSSALTSALSTVTGSPPLLASEATSREPLRRLVASRLTREQELLTRVVVAPLNAVKTCRDGLQKLVLFLQDKTSVDTLNDVLAAVGDRTLVAMLSERGQAQLIANMVDEAVSRLNPQAPTSAASALQLATADSSDDLKMIDDSYVTSATVDVVMAALAAPTYDGLAGVNSKVISVGLPHGFSSVLREKLKLSQFSEQVSSLHKHTDVVVFDLYMADVRYPEVILKPQSRVFELSRFVVREEPQFKSVKVGSRTSDVLDAVPTVDYSDLSNVVTSYGPSAAQADVSYSFMTQDDVASMVRNHVLSYLLELYTRLLTGVPVSEREMYIDDPDASSNNVPFAMKAIVGALNNMFSVQNNNNTAFLNNGIATLLSHVGSSASPATQILNPGAASAFIANLPSDTAYNKLAAASVAVSDMANKRISLGDPAVAAKRLLSPKLYERVFFLFVNPDDYEIDYEATNASPVGQATLSQLMAAGEVEVITETVGNTTRDVYRFKQRRLSQPEMAFEKFFVTVRGYEPLDKASP